MEESERVRVWRDLPSVLWDINLLHYGFFFFCFFFGVHTEPAQLSARKSEKKMSAEGWIPTS